MRHLALLRSSLLARCSQVVPSPRQFVLLQPRKAQVGYLKACSKGMGAEEQMVHV
jgi:hypothetical protein